MQKIDFKNDPRYQLNILVAPPLNRATFSKKCEDYGMHPADAADIIGYVKDLEEHKRSKAYEMAFKMLRDNNIHVILEKLKDEFGGF